MNAQDLRTMLHDRAESLDGTRPDRLDELFGRIRTRRRRRATAVAAATVAVVLSVLGAATLAGGHDQSAPPPVSGPTQTDVAPPTARPVRPIVYLESKDYSLRNGWKGATFHYGDRLVHTGVRFSWTDATDDGVAFSPADGRIYFYFAGESTIEQIGSLGFEPHSYRASGLVRSGNSGSLLAWFNVSDPKSPELMVYDTSQRRLVARHPVPPCKELCTTEAVVGDHVYWSDHGIAYGNTDLANIRMFDVPTGSDSPADRTSYADDLRHRPRGLILGNFPDGDVVVPGEGTTFHVHGSRLDVAALDTATGKPIHMSLPKGYGAGARFNLIQWLDDDRFAVMGGLRGGVEVNDILVCSIAGGDCRLTVPQGDRERVAPGLPIAL